MIRFVYPNVNAREQFSGCGRYMTTVPDDPCLTSDYAIATPNVGHLSKVTTAASFLARESFDAVQEVYECKDHSTEPYVGDSMGLAYLLALIHRSRATLWDQHGVSLDIWCTGTIDVNGDRPILHNVYRNLFDIKLQAFLAAEHDNLFLVPVANIESRHRQLCRQQHVRLLSLDKLLPSFAENIHTQKSIVQIHGDELYRLVEAIFLPPSSASTGQIHEPDAERFPEQLRAGLNDLERQLFLFSKKDVVNDERIVEFDTFGVQLLHLLEGFPKHFEAFHELIPEYQHLAENMLSMIQDQEFRRVLTLRSRSLEQRVEDLTGGLTYGEGFLKNAVNAPSSDSPYSFYTLDFHELDTGIGVEKLLSGDELQESEGIDWLLKTGFTEAEKRLERLTDSESLHLTLDVLWKHFPRILLYYHETFWGVVTYMLTKEPLRWKLRFHAVKTLLKRSLSANQAADVLHRFLPCEQHILSAFLALHPKQECRRFAMQVLPSEARWDILLCPAVPWLVVKELVEKSCEDSSDSYIKALFLLLRPRLLEANSPLAIGKAYHILKLFYYVPLFLQETFFRALIDLHKQLYGKALSSPITSVLEQEMKRSFRAFCAKNRLRDVDITEMTHIPLPIQRKLAHDGYLPEYFICNLRDIIALETVPHVERRPDVIKFLRLRRINARALEKLASNKRLMREYQNRSTFCFNPKANSVLIRTYLSTLTRRDIKELSRNRNVNAYARELAIKYLSRYK